MVKYAVAAIILSLMVVVFSQSVMIRNLTARQGGVLVIGDGVVCRKAANSLLPNDTEIIVMSDEMVSCNTQSALDKLKRLEAAH